MSGIHHPPMMATSPALLKGGCVVDACLHQSNGVTNSPFLLASISSEISPFSSLAVY